MNVALERRNLIRHGTCKQDVYSGYKKVNLGTSSDWFTRTNNAKALVATITERYQVFENGVITYLLMMTNVLSCKDFTNVREYIIELENMQSKLSAHKIDLLQRFVVPRILSSLPSELGMIKTAFNTR